MSIICSAIRQTTSPSARSSSDESTTGPFDPADTSSSVDSLIGPEHDDPDFRIRQRLEASRQGMLQLEALRNKHHKLMQEMRIRWPHSNDAERLGGRSEKHDEPSVVNSHTEIKLNDLRSDSPVSCCVSHRSSLSADSGCVSLSSDLSNQSPMSYIVNPKLSLEEQRRKVESNIATAEIVIDENPRLLATAIESTTALRCNESKRYGKNWTRPKSVCCSYPDENAVTVDSLSFSQITPPPIHRKFSTVGRPECVQTRRPCFASSCVDVRSVISPSPKEQSSMHFPVNQASVLYAKPINLSLSAKIPTSPCMRLRNPQKPPQNPRLVTHIDNQPVFRASRIFVDRSPCNNVQRPKQCMKIERYDSDEESPRLLRAQPAVVLSRQHSCAHSDENSPCESREVHLIESSNSLTNITVLGYHQPLNRRESSLSSETIVVDRYRRRIKEKDWKESEGL